MGLGFVLNHKIQCLVFLNSILPVDDFEFRTDQFLPVSILYVMFQLKCGGILIIKVDVVVCNVCK